MTTIVTKNGSGAPLASDLVQGELAVDLTNKRLYTEDTGGTVIEVGTNPSTIDINAGTIDGTVIGGSSAAAGTFTTFTSTGIDDNATSTALTVTDSGIAATLTTAAQPNITSVGTLTGFTSTGIDDNATSTAITIDSSENVGIGTTSPSKTLHVVATEGTVPSSSGLGMISLIQNNSTTTSSSGIGILGGTGANSSVFFSDADDADVGAIVYEHNNNAMAFTTNDAERMRIDSSGNVGIGGTPSNAFEIIGRLTLSTTAQVKTTTALGQWRVENDSGTFNFAIDNSSGSVFSKGAYSRNIYSAGAYPMVFYTNGTESARIDSGGPLLVGTTSSISNDHKLVVSQDSGPAYIRLQSLSLSADQSTDLAVRGDVSGVIRFATIGAFRNGSASAATGYIRLDETDGGADFLWFDNSAVLRTSQTTSHIGTTTGTVIGTQTSDERLKDIEPSFDYGLSQVMQLKPIAYTRTDEDQPVRKLGFGAQTTSGVIPEAVYDTGECLDGYDADPDNPMAQTPKSDNTKLAMEYVQLIPVLTKAIQELSAQVDSLKAEVAALKGA